MKLDEYGYAVYDRDDEGPDWSVPCPPTRGELETWAQEDESNRRISRYNEAMKLLLKTSEEIDRFLTAEPQEP